MTNAQPISSTDLYLQLGTARAPVLIAVRTDLNSDPDRRLIVGARPMPVTLNNGRSISKAANA
jgi:hypothetical protein